MSSSCVYSALIDTWQFESHPGECVSDPWPKEETGEWEPFEKTEGKTKGFRGPVTDRTESLEPPGSSSIQSHRTGTCNKTSDFAEQGQELFISTFLKTQTLDCPEQFCALNEQTAWWTAHYACGALGLRWQRALVFQHQRDFQDLGTDWNMAGGQEKKKHPRRKEASASPPGEAYGRAAGTTNVLANVAASMQLAWAFTIQWESIIQANLTEKSLGLQLICSAQDKLIHFKSLSFQGIKWVSTDVHGDSFTLFPGYNVPLGISIQLTNLQKLFCLASWNPVIYTPTMWQLILDNKAMQ